MSHQNPAMELAVTRGRVEESRHRVHAVVSGPSGRIVHGWGDLDRITLLRSAAKPFQALPLVEDGAADHFGLTEQEIALCCGSHNSEEAHVETARSILAKAGVSESLLACGTHQPLLRERARELAAAGVRPSPVMSNCSGKHAGMLALAAFHRWPLKGYEQAAHPVQERMTAELAGWTGVPGEEMGLEVDGCGVVCVAVPLRAVAVAAARLAVAARDRSSAQRVVTAMTGNPFMVAGTKRLCTRLMEEEGGRVFAKVGAEAVYLAGDTEQGLGVALKVEDGAWRAAVPALMAVLERAGILSAAAREALGEFVAPPVKNALGEVVGSILARS